MQPAGSEELVEPTSFLCQEHHGPRHRLARYLSRGLKVAVSGVFLALVLLSTGRKLSECGPCPAGGNMVDNGGTCVCPICKDDSWTSVHLMCRRKCFYGDSQCAQCFPNAASVSVKLQDGTVTALAMQRLRVGDLVLTSEGFSRIFAFMDHTADVEAEYLQLETASGYTLSATPDHIVYAHADQRPVFVGSVVEGDILWVAMGLNVSTGFASSRVVRVVRKLERGLHAPLTEQGSIVVSGLLASSYASIKSLRWGSHILVRGHDLAKYTHEPLRVACSLVPTLCGPEWHSTMGRHAWTQLLLDRFGWLQAMNYAYSDLRTALLAEPSALSCFAACSQLVAAAVLSLLFGYGFQAWVPFVAVTFWAVRHRSSSTWKV